MKLLSLAVSSLFTLVVLAGCASSKVTARRPYTGEKIARPDRIIVHDFAATPADVQAGSAFAGRSAEHPTPQTAEQIETGRRLGAQVAKELLAEIRNMGLPAVQAAGEPAPRVGELVIRGYFVAIDLGNAGERVLVGFGSGAAELRTVVEGYLMTAQSDPAAFRRAAAKRRASWSALAPSPQPEIRSA